MPRTVPWRVHIPMPVTNPKSGAISPMVIVYGFIALIELGTLLLCLPISSETGLETGSFNSPLDALFTATSAVCVTGLVVVDTGTHWSAFGQGVILVLIQVGGFGIMTSVALFLWMFGRRIGLRQHFSVLCILAH